MIEAYLGQEEPKAPWVEESGEIERRRSTPLVRHRPDDFAATAEAMRQQVLSIDRIGVSYGRVVALREVSLAVEEGASVALIGANGAGKSTLFKSIVGFLEPQSGGIAFNGRSLVGLAPEKRIRLGIGYAPEGRRVFPGLTVRENLEVAALCGRRERQISSTMPSRCSRSSANDRMREGGSFRAVNSKCWPSVGR